MSMNLEEIMKTYLDKRDEIINEVTIKEMEKSEKLEQINVERNILNLRLERLNENKEEEINQYIKEANNPDFNFYRSYASVLRKDLEKNYTDKENEIKAEIEKLNVEEQTLNNVNYLDLVYAKGLPGIKENTRTELDKLKFEIQTKLERKEIELKLIDLDIENVKNNFYSWQAEERLSSLQPYYKSREQLLNDIKELNILLEETRENYRLIFKDEELEEILKGNIIKEDNIVLPLIEEMEQLEESFDEPIVDDLNIGEIPEIKEPSTDYIDDLLEQVRINQNSFSEKVKEVNSKIDVEKYDKIIEHSQFIDEQKIEEEIDKVINQETKEESFEFVIDDIIDEENPIIRPDIKTEEDIVSGSYSDLIQLVYTDIVDLAENLRSVKIDPSKGELTKTQRYISSKNNEEDRYNVEGYVDMEDKGISLHNGVYLNEEDMQEAIQKYTETNKGRVFKVEAADEVLEVNNKAARKLKKALKRCSTKILLKEKKLSPFDIKRVFGKQVSDEYTSEVELGTVKTELPTGTYINRDEFIGRLFTLFEEKKTSWFSRIADKILNDLDEDDIDYKKMEEYTLREIAEVNKTKTK